MLPNASWPWGFVVREGRQAGLQDDRLPSLAINYSAAALALRHGWSLCRQGSLSSQALCSLQRASFACKTQPVPGKKDAAASPRLWSLTHFAETQVTDLHRCPSSFVPCAIRKMNKWWRASVVMRRASFWSRTNTSWLELFSLPTQMRYDDGGFWSRFSPALAVRMGLCNRLQRLPLSPPLSSFSITLLLLCWTSNDQLAPWGALKFLHFSSRLALPWSAAGHAGRGDICLSEDKG